MRLIYERVQEVLYRAVLVMERFSHRKPDRIVTVAALKSRARLGWRQSKAQFQG
jgi:hypothetical protein